MLLVMTYNVLAQCYVRSSSFPYCKSIKLRWKERSKDLEAMFASSLPVSPHIICLQEVDHFEDFWAAMMKILGYVGIFTKKTGTKADGVAVFWNEEMFEVKTFKQISLDLSHGNEADISHELLSRASSRGSVGAIIYLEHRETQSRFVVATTHLFWDPMQEDVKLLQVRRMLRSIDEFLSLLDASTPTIFAGDFNSLPDSKVYHFITRKHCFKSAYAQYNDNSEPKFTNVNGGARTDDGRMVPRFVGTLDYIFYRSSRYDISFLINPT